MTHTALTPEPIANAALPQAGQVSGSKASGLRISMSENVLVYIGMGSCGLAAGAAATKQAILEFVQQTGWNCQVVETGCLGLCSEEPMVDVALPGKNRLSFVRVQAEEVEELLLEMMQGLLPGAHLLGQHRNTGCIPWEAAPYLDELPFFSNQQRIITARCGIADPTSIESYLAEGGFSTYLECIRHHTPDFVMDTIRRSGLRGRGGSGFSTGAKWALAREQVSDEKYLICNAAESDPGAYMNRFLLEGDPYLVLEGIALAAYALGLSRAILYIMDSFELAASRCQTALQRMQQSGYTGFNILETGVDLHISILKMPGAYVCGEETALIKSIEGKRAIPEPKPPFPSEKGLYGRPTIINNVETLANVPVAMRLGADQYRMNGTVDDPGTKIFCVTGQGIRRGIVEVAMGTPLSKIVYAIGGGTPEGTQVKAIQLGGPSGHCLPVSKLNLVTGYQSMQAQGIALGTGGLVVLSSNTCMVDLAAFNAAFLMRESCGKCIPCREGTRRVAEIMHAITHRSRQVVAHEGLRRFRGVMQLRELAEVMQETSLCGLGRNATNALTDMIEHFRDEFEEHIYERRCSTGTCRELRLFAIDAEKCNGCYACHKVCPEYAIIGQPRQPHFVVSNKCTGCGKCAEACKFNAVVQV